MQPENESQTLIQTLERNVLRDTQYNRRSFEPAIHAYFVNQSSPEYIEKLASYSRTNPYLSDEQKSRLTKPKSFDDQMRPDFEDSALGASSPYFNNEAKPDFVKLNRAIYDKLFLTPASDPWLGLSPDDAFVALRNGGVQAATSGQRVAQQP